MIDDLNKLLAVMDIGQDKDSNNVTLGHLSEHINKQDGVVFTLVEAGGAKVGSAKITITTSTAIIKLKAFRYGSRFGIASDLITNKTSNEVHCYQWISGGVKMRTGPTELEKPLTEIVLKIIDCL